MNETDHTLAQADIVARTTRPKRSKSYHPVRPRIRTQQPAWWNEATELMRLQTDDLILDGCRVLDINDNKEWRVAYRTNKGYAVVNIRRTRITIALHA